MRDLYQTMARGFWEELSLNMNRFVTLSSMAYFYWRTTLTEALKHHPTRQIQKLPFELDCWVNRAKFGGRCFPQKQVFSSPQDGEDYEFVLRYLIDGDAVSLYPASMIRDRPLLPEVVGVGVRALRLRRIRTIDTRVRAIAVQAAFTDDALAESAPVRWPPMAPSWLSWTPR